MKLIQANRRRQPNGNHLGEAIERDRFPLSRRVRELKAILAKLDPPRPAPAPYPPAVSNGCAKT